MLTVDEIRREMADCGYLPTKRAYKFRNPKPEEGEKMEEKFCKNHPGRPARRAKSGRNMGLCDECILAARRKGAENRLARKSGKSVPKRSRTYTKKEKPSVSVVNIAPPGRLILAETYTCPKCGAQLVLEK